MSFLLISHDRATVRYVGEIVEEALRTNVGVMLKSW
jgi:hypothetical protein